jgi:hypothetical protein
MMNWNESINTIANIEQDWAMQTCRTQAQPCEFYCPIMLLSLCLRKGTTSSPSLKYNAYEQAQGCCSLTGFSSSPRLKEKKKNRLEKLWSHHSLIAILNLLTAD